MYKSLPDAGKRITSLFEISEMGHSELLGSSNELNFRLPYPLLTEKREALVKASIKFSKSFHVTLN